MTLGINGQLRADVGQRLERERQKHNESLGGGERPRSRRALGEAPQSHQPWFPTPLCLQPPTPISLPPSLSPAQLGHCQGLRRGCVQGMLVPPGDSGNFSIQHFLWERWVEGHWKAAFRALGPCPALEAEEGSLTVAKGKGYF